VTVASDGSLEALLPAGSPFQVVSMKSYGGVIVEAPAVPRDHVHPGGHRSPVAARLPAVGAPLGLEAPQPSRAPEVAREQPPWVLPVQAGQDVDIEVGLPVGPVAEPGGFISSTITVGSPLQGLWRQDVPLLANLALKGDIKIAVDVPEPLIDRVTEYSYNPSVPFTFVVPCFVSKPSPPQEVKGTIQPVALPPGVSMPAVNFTLQPQQKANASFTLSVDRSSSTWFDDETPYFFTIKVAYQTRPRRLRSRRGRRQ
jgi:hypothetical protein